MVLMIESLSWNMVIYRWNCATTVPHISKKVNPGGQFPCQIGVEESLVEPAAGWGLAAEFRTWTLVSRMTTPATS